MMSNIAMEAESFAVQTRPFSGTTARSAADARADHCRGRLPLRAIGQRKAIVVFTKFGRHGAARSPARRHVPIFAFCEIDEVARELAVIMACIRYRRCA